MTDYMKEAERLLEQYDDACLSIIDMSEEQARAALLAHTQRGAVPEGVQHKLTQLKTQMISYPWSSGSALLLLDEIIAMTPAAPDQFRDAAKMMAEPAEVPMPEPDMSVWDTEEVRTYSDECIQQYGAACRAAGESAGYARGLAEAGWDADAFRAAVRLGLCVNCYTSSDCMADGSAAVEIYASEIADSIHVKAIPDPYAAARSAVFAAANQIDALRGEVKP